MHTRTISLLVGFLLLSAAAPGGRVTAASEQIEKSELERLKDQVAELTRLVEQMQKERRTPPEGKAGDKPPASTLDPVRREQPEDPLHATLDQMREKQDEDPLQAALAQVRDEPGEDPLQAMLGQTREEQAISAPAPRGGLAGALQTFNPDISVVIDSLYHSDNARGGIGPVLERVEGFAPVRDPGGFDNGFNLREAELFFSSQVDPFFRAYTSVVLTEEGAAVEEAVAQTTFLPYGFQLKGGLFLSEFSRSNWQHPHDWDFADKPLVSALIFGDGGLREKGLQLTWLAPTPFHLLLGTEVLQGENGDMFGHLGRGDSEDVLRDRRGPRLWLQWAKFSPPLPGAHEAQVGLFHGYGRHQERWDDAFDGWLDGHSRFLGTDFVYKYDAPYIHGKGDVIVQGEYLFRHRDLTLEASDTSPALVGNARVDRQDGLYLQAVYGFAPRWRAGLRWDHVGLINRRRLPDGTTERFDDTYRLSAMVDFFPTEFSRFRLQVSRGEYAVDGEREDVYQVFLQAIFALGAHGAHKF